MNVQELEKEERLLINCARIKMPLHLVDQTRELCSADLKWSRILSLSERHGLSPLLYHSLRAINLHDQIGSDVMDRLKTAYYSNALRNLRLYDELRLILAGFDQAGIKSIVLKGAALAEPVYKNVALRVMSDIDLLIQKEDLKRAQSVMKQLGYSSGQKRLAEWHIRNHHHLLAYTFQGRVAPVEIHFDLFPPMYNFTMEIDDFWKATRSCKIQNAEMRVFSVEDQILHLAVHGALLGGRFIDLCNLCDISEILSLYGDQVNWERLFEKDKDRTIVKNLHTSLYLVRYLLGNEKVPVGALTRLEGFSTSHYRKWIVKRSFKDALSSNGRTIDEALWLDRNSDRWRLLLQIMRRRFDKQMLKHSKTSGKGNNVRFLVYLIRSFGRYMISRLTTVLRIKTDPS